MRVVLLIFLCAGSMVATDLDQFLEQPKNTTVKENETAIFRCSVFNLSTAWLVNGSDAGYTRFRQRGFSIVLDPSDYTRSELHVAGYLYNNNTRIICVAIWEYPTLIFIKSQTALLIVQEASEPLVTRTDQHPSILPTKIKEFPISERYEAVTSRHPDSSSIKQRQTVNSSTVLTQKISTEQGIVFVLLGIIVPVIVTILMVVIFTLLILVISKNKRKVCDKVVDEDHCNISLDPNPVYECKKPIQTQKNELYELSKQIQCQQNSAYDNVVFHQ